MSFTDEIKDLVICGHINSQSKYPPEFAGKPGVEEQVQAAVNKEIPVEDMFQVLFRYANPVILNAYLNIFFLQIRKPGL